MYSSSRSHPTIYYSPNFALKFISFLLLKSSMNEESTFLAFSRVFQANYHQSNSTDPFEHDDLPKFIVHYKHMRPGYRDLCWWKLTYIYEKNKVIYHDDGFVDSSTDTWQIVQVSHVSYSNKYNINQWCVSAPFLFLSRLLVWSLSSLLMYEGLSFWKGCSQYYPTFLNHTQI